MEALSGDSACKFSEHSRTITYHAPKLARDSKHAHRMLLRRFAGTAVEHVVPRRADRTGHEARKPERNKRNRGGTTSEPLVFIYIHDLARIAES